MSVANNYNLSFYILTLSNGLKKPSIGVSIMNGDSQNYEIANFLEPNGLELIQHIKDEINSLDFAYVFNRYKIWGYNDSESIEISNSIPNQPIVIFNNGGKEIIVPLLDFLQILDEWKAFILSVPTPHWLDQR